ncbi:hypothetical protein [Pandoraea sputorum]|uniref:Uncharacterized protein n=1 Tax=Pandoraea sputorum TaxID=93222 RepID=A0A5E5B4R4_9BURK|nr:hypothetical protein [Pandoraea sputorum]VVE80167.1 hypothetical protein PSP31121_02584 [Pandoraea sputorum]
MIQPTFTSPSVPLAQAQEPSSTAPAQTELAADLREVTQRDGIYDGHHTDFEREFQRSSVGQLVASGDEYTPNPDGKPPFVITNPKVRPTNPTNAQSAQTIRTTTHSTSSIPHGGLDFNNPDFSEEDLRQSVRTARTEKRPVPVGGLEQRYPDIGDHLCPDSTGRNLQEDSGDHSPTE